MSNKAFKTNSFCLGGRHHSSATSFKSGVTKTKQNFLIGICVQ